MPKLSLYPAVYPYVLAGVLTRRLSELHRTDKTRPGEGPSGGLPGEAANGRDGHNIGNARRTSVLNVNYIHDGEM
jgi:hypothetical protein